MRVLLLAAVLAAAAGPATGQSTQAFKLLMRGEYVAAADAGRKQGNAESLSAAARADLVRAAYLAKSRGEATVLVEEATRLADAALAKDPGNYYALLQRAAALGYMSSLKTSRRMTGQARDVMVLLTKTTPQKPEAWIAYGAWNGEVVAKLGPFIAGTVLGASRGKMEQSLASAFARDPSSPLPLAYRGLLLTRLGDAKAARPYLAQAQTLKPANAYDAMIRGHASEVLKLVDAGEAKAAKARANRLASFGWLRAIEDS